jgi:hypothetical protein
MEMGVLDRLVSCVAKDSQQRLTKCSSMYQGVAWIGCFLLYHPTKHSRLGDLSNMERIKRIDYLGGLLSVGGLTLLYATPSGKHLHDANNDD